MVLGLAVDREAFGRRVAGGALRANLIGGVGLDDIPFPPADETPAPGRDVHAQILNDS
jgi:hypothetical protein